MNSTSLKNLEVSMIRSMPFIAPLILENDKAMGFELLVPWAKAGAILQTTILCLQARNL